MEVSVLDGLPAAAALSTIGRLDGQDARAQYARLARQGEKVHAVANQQAQNKRGTPE